MPGNLFVVATPIGNLEDISLRAINTLKEVDIIVAEDTRITNRLLNRYGIKNKIISYNNYNENKKFEYLLELLNSYVFGSFTEKE